MTTNTAGHGQQDAWPKPSVESGPHVEMDMDFEIDVNMDVDIDDELEKYADSIAGPLNASPVLPGSVVSVRAPGAATPSMVEAVLEIAGRTFVSISREGVSTKLEASGVEVLERGTWKSATVIGERVSYAFDGDVRTTDVVGLTLTATGAEAAILADENVVETAFLTVATRPIMTGDVIAYPGSPGDPIVHDVVVAIEVARTNGGDREVIYATSRNDGIKNPVLVAATGAEATPPIGAMAFDRRSGDHGSVAGLSVADGGKVLLIDLFENPKWIAAGDVVIDDGLKDQIAPGDVCVAVLGNRDKSRQYVGRATKVLKKEYGESPIIVTLELEDLQKIDFDSRLITARRKGALHPPPIKLGHQVHAVMKSNKGMEVKSMEARSHAVENDGSIVYEVAARVSDKLFQVADGDIFPGSEGRVWE